MQQWHFNLRSPSDFLLVYIHRCVLEIKGIHRRVEIFFQNTSAKHGRFFFQTRFPWSNFYLGSHKRTTLQTHKQPTTPFRLHKVDAISRSSVLRTSLFFLKRPVQMLFCLKLVHKTGVIKWDPFWGESNNTHSIMAILRDFPFNNALFWLGNIIMTPNKVSSVHGWEDKLSKSIFCIIS